MADWGDMREAWRANRVWERASGDLPRKLERALGSTAPGDTETVTLWRNPNDRLWWQPSAATMSNLSIRDKGWEAAEFTRVSPVRPASSTEGGEDA